VVLAALLRRHAVFLFAPLLYVLAMLLYMGSIFLDSVPRIISRPAPGSMYRSPQLYARLCADMDDDNATDAVSASSPPVHLCPGSVGLGVYLCWGCIRCGVGLLGSVGMRNFHMAVALIVGCELS
jgi:hypothetical protein